MTIAIALKVNDGIVLCADSAITLYDETGNVTNVHNNANKICNLYKGCPIGFVTWGAGAIGQSSTATLAKDLRASLSGEDPEWRLDPARYSIEDVAKVTDRFFRTLHSKAFDKLPKEKRPYLGFLVAGYSAGADHPETWGCGVPSDDDAPVRLQERQVSTLNWWGEPEPITRLLLGTGLQFPKALVSALGISEAEAEAAVPKVRAAMATHFIHAAMPIQDAIDFAEFLANVAINWARFKDGHATVGGPIEIATITKHEGFKWVKRKHFYPARLNQ